MVTVEHWKGLVVNEGESQPDGKAPVVNEVEEEGGEGGKGGEEQGVLHQVGGHGANDKAQAMQVVIKIYVRELKTDTVLDMLAFN